MGLEIKGINEYKYLVLILDKETNKYKDKTKEIFYLRDDSDSYYIGYKSNRQYYTMKKYKVNIYEATEEIKFSKGKVVINDNTDFSILKIIKYGKYYKVFFKDYSSYLFNDLKEDEGILYFDSLEEAKDCGDDLLNYYKKLSKAAKSKVLDELSIESLLDNLYERVNKVNKDSVLSSYAKKENIKRDFNKDSLIYPFRTNLSQNKALEECFKNQMSVISGPPGTGKTQVILNIICNALYNNLKVAVISNNNNAVTNVYDKLKENGYDFFIANLGNSKNIESFFLKEIDLKESINNLYISNLEDKISKTKNKIIVSLDIFNKLQSIKHNKYEYEKELENYNKLHKDNNIKIKIKKCNYLELKTYLMSINKLNIFNKLNLLLKYGIKKYDVSKIDDYLIYLDKLHLESKVNELNNQYNRLLNRYNSFNYEELNDRLIKDSKIVFNKFLKDYYSNINDKNFNKENYKLDYDNFLKRYPVVLSTTHSLLRNMDLTSMFDLIIVDESSQSDLLTSVLPMNFTKNIVVVGDRKQLSQIDNKTIYPESEQLCMEYSISNTYKYKNNSLLDSFTKIKSIPITTLKEHYRCEYKIIDFCNKKFYDNELIICSKELDDSLCIIHTVEGNHCRKNPNGSGYYSDREALEIKELIKNIDSKNIGVISPFKAQAEYIRNLLEEEYDYVEVDTVHKYQGREKEIVIISTVVNDIKDIKEDFISDYVTNSKLLNVAISRSIKKLYFVVSDGVYNSKNNTIKDFIDYVSYYSNNIKKGCITSVFDQLYQNNYESIKESKLNNYVDSYAEEIMINLLNKVLKEYPDLGCSMHVRLKSLINNIEGFNINEIKYINHPNTHVDFVIYNKITHNPILCVEVDGTKYHDYNKKQKNHDEIKDKVLEQNGLNILRLKTNGSNEEELIKETIDSII